MSFFFASRGRQRFALCEIVTVRVNFEKQQTRTKRPFSRADEHVIRQRFNAYAYTSIYSYTIFIGNMA